MKITLLSLTLLTGSTSALKAQHFTLTDTSFDVGDILVHPVYFDYDGHGILPRSYAFLDSFAAFLNSHTQLSIEIGVHTDQRGAETYNQVLSQRRAEMIHHYLTHLGEVSGERLSAAGYGETAPLVGQDAIEHMDDDVAKDQAYSKNRRVVFQITEIVK